MNQINNGKWCCFTFLESMQTQPAQPPSGRIAHLFSCVSCLKRTFQCLDT
ncbi:MAG: hypothetical protein LBK82_03245 [Planctomycetaceae bacterium]|nr:hypothetical protein [Planctomycetaceae bacterium]